LKLINCAIHDGGNLPYFSLPRAKTSQARELMFGRVAEDFMRAEVLPCAAETHAGDCALCALARTGRADVTGIAGIGYALTAANYELGMMNYDFKFCIHHS
jgi:hypothetical protein